MPKKNIYVKEKDLSIFDEAEKIGKDSISNIIVDALNLYIQEKKIKEECFEKIIINEGIKDGDALRIKRKYFFGKYLSGFEDIDEENVYYNINIYTTIKDKILVTKHQSNIGKYKDNYKYFIYNNLDEAKEDNDIPQNVYEEAIETLENKSMGYLDV